MTIVEKQIDFSNWKIHVQSCVQKYWFFNININILEYWPWSWYWLLVLVNIDIGIDIGIQQDIDIDLDIDLDFLGGKLLISILILKKKIWKILILILNKNFILSHLWIVVVRYSLLLICTWMIYHSKRGYLSALKCLGRHKSMIVQSYFTQNERDITTWLMEIGNLLLWMSS